MLMDLQPENVCDAAQERSWIPIKCQTDLLLKSGSKQKSLANHNRLIGP
jgi:hypothetical protein